MERVLPMPLEDEFSDIIKKARIGRGLSVEACAAACGLDAHRLRLFESGRRNPTEAEVQAIARALQLSARPLAEIAAGTWHPKADAAPHIETVLGDIGGYPVKGYVLYDQGEAVFIDTASRASAMLETLDRVGAQLTAVCLTHGHADHADGLDMILNKWRVPVYLGPEDAALLSWRPPQDLLRAPTDGASLTVGSHTLRCMATPGHTPGGTCYLVATLEPLVCFVGDTLFAGSIGRSNPSSLYPAHLASVRRRVLALPASTLLLPGHGPATTVSEEMAHNPFAAAGTDER